ncbi:AAA family ATPase [Haloplanus sp.]|uniref:AAA family ATPase n=1 Tax=Haloplanus sp. TaxID=1961696 RepID=UPI00261A7101|nr:AAA family ATPase [Haloplanus sp.]
MLEDFLETLGDELEVQENEYGRIVDAPEAESVTARELLAVRANKERLMYTAKLEAFKKVRNRLERKVSLLGEAVQKELTSQTDQNLDIEENVDEIETVLSGYERESISKDRSLGKIDRRLDDMRRTDDLSVDKDMEVIEEKSGETTRRRSELSHLAEDILNEDDDAGETDGPVADMITTDVGVDLDDYVGREELKETMDRKVFSHAENPELDEEFDIDPANGFVLYGPPGTGKTHFVRCMAGEVDMPFVEIDITEMTSKYVNESAQLVGEVFEEVREHGPMMICINELDAVAKSRDADMTASDQRVINKLLTEVETLQDSRTIIVGTTNKPGELDNAVTRSGRFTDTFEVGIPDAGFRRKLIGEFMTDRPLAPEWDLDRVVDVTEGCAPADLEGVCNESARIARDHYIETGEKGITNAMFETAFEDILG